MKPQEKPRNPRTSTVGRGKALPPSEVRGASAYSDEHVNLSHGDSLDFYHNWEQPTVIVSDGAYGILGFEGDTSDHLGIPEWYEAHIAAWSKKASAQTTLWFWNSEIGWAAAHPILQKYGWRYVNANIWNKGRAHVAGNVNTAKIRRFPVVSEVCVQYVFEAKIEDQPLQRWLHKEWKRTGLTMKSANEACGVKDAATRKYLDQGHLWYFPPPEVFSKMAQYANEKGKPEGRPYFSMDGTSPMTSEDWSRMRSKFNCPHGWMNVWDRPPLKGTERLKVTDSSGKVAHLNQKPLDLMKLIIEASSDPGDVIWEPFGGLFSASLAAKQTERKAFSAEIDRDYYELAITRFKTQPDLFS